MKPRYFDIHSHLNLEDFDNDREDVIKKLKNDGIFTTTVGTDYKSSLFAIELADRHENIFASVGLHPNDVDSEDFDYDKFLELAKKDRVVAIGECGLDYFYNQEKDFKEKQKNIFEKHIEISIQTGKILMIHARPSRGTMDAYTDVLDILESFKNTNLNLRANFHFFAGDLGIAKRIIDLGFSMSFDGPITFSKDYDEVIIYTPIEYIMVETDSPFAAPVPYRGRRSDPSMVVEVIKKIAELKSMDTEEVSKILLNNSFKIFNIHY
jgi:TatD DNase family protein